MPGDTRIDEGDWRDWVPKLFGWEPESFAGFHEDFYEHISSFEEGVRSRPRVNLWPRDFAKSSCLEQSAAFLGASDRVNYCLYVCETQAQANNHVDQIKTHLVSEPFERFYPAHAERAMTEFGFSKGWNRQRARTAGGFTIDALGLDTAARGIKLDDVRPDLLILDDIDDELDTERASDKKIRRITRKVLPTGGGQASVLAGQNVISKHGLFTRWAKGESDVLADREVSGPFPAIEDMEFTYTDEGITVMAGRPAWALRDLDWATRKIRDWTLRVFRTEAQQQLQEPPGGLFSDLAFEDLRVSRDEVPELVRVVCWIDPAITETGDCHAIQIDGLGADDRIYRLFSWEQQDRPLGTFKRAFRACLRHGATTLGVETDQGGQAWESVFNRAWEALVRDPDWPHITKSTRKPQYDSDKAGGGKGNKVHRWNQMLGDYEDGRFRHVTGTADVLESALHRVPVTKPFDLADAAYWSWHDLDSGTTGRRSPLPSSSSRQSGR
jgi:hypothetical protein